MRHHHTLEICGLFRLMLSFQYMRKVLTCMEEVEALERGGAFKAE